MATKEVILAGYNFLIEKIGQLSDNIERMEREGTTNMPALDAKNPENAGKTQYKIDQAIRSEYVAKRDALVAKYPQFFKVELQ